MKTEDKIELFKKTFQGRLDVVPKYWVSENGSGYSPVCANEWKKNICNKPDGKCAPCRNKKYIPLSDKLILDHLRGKHIIGIYPLLTDNTCWFIASDFDDHNGDKNPFEDVKAFIEACQVQEIPCYALRSKSGEGYHVYVFFNTPVPAWKARIVVFALLQEAGVIGEDVKITSFDRLFPSQDTHSGEGLGNLIALPFQGKAVKFGHTLLLSPESYTEQYKDQLNALLSIKRVDESALDELIREWNLEQVKPTDGKSTNPAGWLTEALKGVRESDPGRNVTGTKIAGYFIHKLHEQDVLTILTAWNVHNEPPLEEEVVQRIVESVGRYKIMGGGGGPNAGRQKIKISFG